MSSKSTKNNLDALKDEETRLIADSLEYLQENYDEYITGKMRTHDFPVMPNIGSLILSTVDFTVVFAQEEYFDVDISNYIPKGFKNISVSEYIEFKEQEDRRAVYDSYRYISNNFLDQDILPAELPISFTEAYTIITTFVFTLTLIEDKIVTEGTSPTIN